MSTFKKSTKSKFGSETHLLDDSFKNDPPVKNETSGELRQKTLNIMNRQIRARKQINDNFMKNLTKIIENLEADHDALKDNVQKVEQLSACIVKCMQQATTACNEKLEAVKAIFLAFKKECEEIDAGQKAEADKLGDELAEDIQKLKQKLIADTKRVTRENMEKAEGLILRGAMKPDDRPLWFDVYKAFPPTTEPKYARPKPENQFIKPILYKEDAIRAKFHAKGQGLSVNMLSLSGETQTRKLVQKYQQLQSEGVAEEELLQKSVEAVGSARQAAAEYSKTTPNNPDSVTAKVLAEADLKNIFKE